MQLIVSPTHNQGNILDILITNIEDIIHNVVNIEDLIHNVVIKEMFSPLCSDHCFDTFMSQLVASNPFHQRKTRYILNYNRTDLVPGTLNEYLLDVDFSNNCFISPNIDTVGLNLKCTIFTAVTLFKPKTKVNSHLPPKWFTSQIRHSLHKIHSL